MCASSLSRTCEVRAERVLANAKSATCEAPSSTLSPLRGEGAGIVRVATLNGDPVSPSRRASIARSTVSTTGSLDGACNLTSGGQQHLLGGLLFLLSAGFSLIFGLMRIPNLMHGSFFMLGAYFGATSDCSAASISGSPRSAARRRRGGDRRPRSSACCCGGSPAQELAQVLLTLGLSFIVADLCLMMWTGDPDQPRDTAGSLRGAVQVAGLSFPIYRLAIVVIAVVIARRAVAADRPDAARRHDPRRRRRRADGARRRHQGVAPVHAGVLRWARGSRRSAA